MNMEKFTERSRGFLQAAQTIAMRESHQRLAPEHLLKAMMDDDQGLSANLIRRAGGEPARVTEAVNAVIAKAAKVTGDAQPFMDPGLVRVLDEAEKVASKAGDSFVPVERILMALAMVASKAKDALGVQVTNNPNAPEVRLTEEQVREKYPWDYDQLTAECRKRYTGFKSDQKYHNCRKKLAGDKRFSHVRELDPGNPKSAKKPFFNANILAEFDKIYTRA